MTSSKKTLLGIGILIIIAIGTLAWSYMPNKNTGGIDLSQAKTLEADMLYVLEHFTVTMSKGWTSFEAESDPGGLHFAAPGSLDSNLITSVSLKEFYNPDETLDSFSNVFLDGVSELVESNTGVSKVGVPYRTIESRTERADEPVHSMNYLAGTKNHYLLISVNMSGQDNNDAGWIALKPEIQKILDTVVALK